MHILMISGTLPHPPHSGGAIRVLGLLKGLRAAGHKVTLLAFHDGDPHDLGPLSVVCERVLTAPPPARTSVERLRLLLTTGTADIATRLYSPAMTAHLHAQLRDHTFDLVQLEGIEVAVYLDEVRRHDPAIPVIFDTFNAEASLQAAIAEVDRTHVTRLPKAVYSAIQASRIAEFERTLVRAATATVTVSEADAAEMRAYGPSGPVYVVPNGIDTSVYGAPQHNLSLRDNALVFTGKMDYRPNVDAVLWFAESVMPRLCERGDGHLYIVGQKPTRDVVALGESDNITVTGFVPEVLPYLFAASVYVAPLRMGSGTRLKLLEAMAAQCAVVATPIAASGMMATSHDHMHIADTPESMADALTGLLQNAAARADLGASARAFVTEHYDWTALVPRLLRAYEELGLA